MPEPTSKPPSTHPQDSKDEPFPWTRVLYANRKEPQKPGDLDKYKRGDVKNKDLEIEYEKPESRQNVIAKAIELVLAFCIAFFALLQWVTTLSNNASTSNQTGQLISAAKINAYASQQNALAAGNFANSASGINQGVNSAVVRLQEQANAVELSRETSEAQSAKSLDATVTSFQLDQRAWLGLEPVQADMSTLGGNFALKNIVLSLKNTGKTPALHVIGICILVFRPSWHPDRDVTPDYDTEVMDTRIQKSLREQSEETTPKGASLGHYSSGTLETDILLGMDQRDQIASPNGEVIFQIPSVYGVQPKSGDLDTDVFIVGEFTYSDIFSKKSTPLHLTKFCFVQADIPDGKKGFAPCNGHNAMT
jgi:hypothetical protein